MLHRESTLAYQTAAASGAITQADLLQLVYRHLAQDLLRAGNATRRNEVEARCNASKHALLLLGHLEGWINLIEEAEVEESLQAFYKMIRSSLLHLQSFPDVNGFEQLAQYVLDISAAWQTKLDILSFSRVPTPPGAPEQRTGISFLA